MPHEHGRGFDDVVVDAHQDQIVDLYAGIGRTHSKLLEAVVQAKLEWSGIWGSAATKPSVNRETDASG
jgi:hypothetical protein